MDQENKESRIVVEAGGAGMRMDLFLSRHLQAYSRSMLQKLVDEGRILLNGETVRKKAQLKAGDVIELDQRSLNSRSAITLAPQNIALDIIYEDEYFVAINKAAGMVVHPGSGNRDGTLVNSLLYHFPALSEGFDTDRPGIVHRLDKDTSGVLLVAKTNPAHAVFAALFAERRVEKIYSGFCIGKRPQEHGMIEAALGRSSANPIKRAVVEDGKAASTEYWLEKHHCGLSQLRFRLHTGRTHQIRVHCCHAGFPIVNDPLYGGGRDKVRSLQPLERAFANKLFDCFARHALHAHRLCFVHPFTNKDVELEAPFPPDFQAARDYFAFAAR
jgi:23S rRNA pseudouridine1911/1915/1917 synthase